MTRVRLLMVSLLATGCFTPTNWGPTFDGGGGPLPCTPSCLEGELCVSGTCQPRSCANVTCLAGSVCVRGRCFPTQCPSGACSADEVCDGRRCVLASCAGVVCPFGTCANGGCPACSQLEYFEPDAGRCAPRKSTSSPCSDPGQCTTGYCASGVCCDSPCLGQCEVCDTGTCSLRPPLDPGGPTACFPGRCTGTARACSSACTADTECAGGAWCLNNQCVMDLAQGQSCPRPSACLSGNCVDGVCCDQPCNGPCAVCVPPQGTDGGLPPAGVCRAPPRTEVDAACNFLFCGTVIGCPPGCSFDTDCYQRRCQNSACVPLLPAGSACTRNTQCLYGSCKDGFCCSSECTGGCRQCLGDGGCSVFADGNTSAACAVNLVCAQGECCDSACQGVCERCDTPQLPGKCSPVAGPRYACNGYFACMGDGGCSTTCSVFTGCAAEGYCQAGTCEKRCDPKLCGQQGPGYCCLANNICSPPPTGPPFFVCMDE